MLSPSLGRCCAGALRLRLRRRRQVRTGGRRGSCSHRGAPLTLAARLRVRARWMRLHWEENAAASILIHGSLPIHFLQLQSAWRAIIDGVMQPAALQPIITHGVRCAILQTDQRRRSGAGYVSRHSVRVIGALRRSLRVVVIVAGRTIAVHHCAGSSYAQIVVGGERVAARQILVWTGIIGGIAIRDRVARISRAWIIRVTEARERAISERVISVKSRPAPTEIEEGVEAEGAKAKAAEAKAAVKASESSPESPATAKASAESANRIAAEPIDASEAVTGSRGNAGGRSATREWSARCRAEMIGSEGGIP